MNNLREKIDKHANIIAEALLWILWFIAIAMFGILTLGVCKIIMGAYFELTSLKTVTDNKGIIEILKGLELVLVAPLIYVLVLSLVKYISVVSPSQGPVNLDDRKKYINYAIMEIVNVKILIVGVFISVLVLHSLTLILEDTSPNPPIIFISSILIILIIYYFVLDKLIEKFRKD